MKNLILISVTAAFLMNCGVLPTNSQETETQRPETSQNISQIVVEYSRLVSSEPGIIDTPSKALRVGIEFEMQSGVILKEDRNELDLHYKAFEVTNQAVYVNHGYIQQWENLTGNRVLNIIVTY